MPKDVQSENLVIRADGQDSIPLPSQEFIANAQFLRDGADLHLVTPDGRDLTIEGYFNQNPPPALDSADGARLSPDIVQSFLTTAHAGQYAAAGNSMTDESPVGQITEIIGKATVTHADGTKSEAIVGMSVREGDVIETSAEGAVNILFVDNTTFAISENAKLAIDEYAYNPADQSGTSFFSMLRGVFVYTSGLIGKSDAADVNINTPVGSIGIRGTVVAGEIDPSGKDSRITIIDGAVVITNASGSIELNDQLETALLTGYNNVPQNAGQMDASQFSQHYSSLTGIAHDTFQKSGLPLKPAGDLNQPETDQQTQPTDGGETTEPPADSGTDGKTDDGATTAPLMNETIYMGETLPPPPDSSLTSDPMMETTSYMPPPPPPDGSIIFMPPPLPSGQTSTDGTITGTTSPPPPVLGFVGASGPLPEFMSAGLVVGKVNAFNFGSGLNFTITGTGNDVLVWSRDAMGTPSPGLAESGIQVNSQAFSINAITGDITVNDPLALYHKLGGAIGFTVQVTDSLGHSQSINVGFAIDSSPGTIPYILGTAGNNDLVPSNALIAPGVNAAEFFAGLDGNDIIQGRGGADYMSGGNGNDIMNPGDIGFARIDGGDGADTLQLRDALHSSTMTMNFIADGYAGKIKNVETLDLSGSASTGPSVNIANLRIADVFAISGPGHTLHITESTNLTGGNVSLFASEWKVGTLAGAQLTAGAVTHGAGYQLQGQIADTAGNMVTVTLVIDPSDTAVGLTAL